MAERPRGMGRGLAAILTATAPAGTDPGPVGGDLRQVPVELVVPNPSQPRQRFDEDALDALAGSLAERGVLQPILVRPVPGGTNDLIAGERRWRAAQLAGFETVPAVVRAQDDVASLELALVENMVREDLNPVEEARAAAEAAAPVKARRVRRGDPHPDQLAAASELADGLQRALGAPVQVAPKGEGYRVTLTVDSHEDALALLGRVAAGTSV